MMDKYGVDETTQDSDGAAKTAAKGCPWCGAEPEQHGPVLKCPNCGTAPFEKGTSDGR